MPPLRVVIADDVVQIRTALRKVLALDAGTFEVVGEADDGRQAIEVTGRTQPDVVLLDLSMPVMDGLEALPEIVTVVPTARVIIFSGFEDPALVEQALRLGACAYVTKGQPVRRVITELRRVCAGLPSAPALGPAQLNAASASL